MKKVKSYLIVALILGCLIFTLVGCGQGSKNISNEQNGGTSSGESVNNEGDMAEETKEVKTKYDIDVYSKENSSGNYFYFLTNTQKGIYFYKRGYIYFICNIIKCFIVFS